MEGVDSKEERRSGTESGQKVGIGEVAVLVWLYTSVTRPLLQFAAAKRECLPRYNASDISAWPGLHAG